MILMQHRLLLSVIASATKDPDELVPVSGLHALENHQLKRSDKHLTKTVHNTQPDTK